MDQFRTEWRPQCGWFVGVGTYTREGGTMMILDTEPDLVHHHDWVMMELLAPDYTY